MGIREERIYLIDLDSILYFFVEQAGVKIITEQKLIYKCKHSLKYWEERLTKHDFFKCHRSVLVNMEKVKEVVPSFNSTFSLRFNGNFNEVPVGRRYLYGFKQYIGL